MRMCSIKSFGGIGLSGKKFPRELWKIGRAASRGLDGCLWETYGFFFSFSRDGKNKHLKAINIRKMHVWPVAKSCLTVYSPTRLLCPWTFPGKNTGVGSHFLLQEIFPTEGLNLHLLQVGFFPTASPGKPKYIYKYSIHLISSCLLFHTKNEVVSLVSGTVQRTANSADEISCPAIM